MLVTAVGDVQHAAHAQLHVKHHTRTNATVAFFG
jgi:hypothetical protein